MSDGPMSDTALLPPLTRVPGLLDGVEEARSAVASAASVSLAVLDDEQLAAAVQGAARLRSQTDALELALAAEAERRAVARDSGDTGTDEWLARLTGDRREVLRGGLRIARLLQERYATTAAALSAGEIRLEQARVIVNGLDVSADDATPAQQREAEERLLAKATGAATRSGVPMPPARLRRAVRRAYDQIDADLARRHFERSVRANHHRGASNTWLTLHDRGDGTFDGRFSIPELHGQILAGVLDRLTAPRRHGRDAVGAPVLDDVAGAEGSGLGWADKLGLAFCELIEHLPSDRLSRSLVTVMAMVDLDVLRSGLGVATTTTGADLTAGEVRRLACEAGIVPAVMGGASMPLDLGRTRRLHNDKQRQAYAVLHDTCAIASCDRPFAWCEIHHPQPWAHGGRTDLTNGLPLCWHHHRAAHDPTFELRSHSPTEWVLVRRPPPNRRQ